MAKWFLAVSIGIVALAVVFVVYEKPRPAAPPALQAQVDPTAQGVSSGAPAPPSLQFTLPRIVNYSSYPPARHFPAVPSLHQQEYLEAQLARLTQKLQLTPAQQAATKATMEQVVSGRPIVKTVDQTLHEILDADQLAQWEQLKRAGQTAGVISYANDVVRRVDLITSLSDAQKKQLFQALFDGEMKHGARNSFRSRAEMDAYDAERNAAADVVMARILTSAQMLIFRQQTEAAAVAASPPPTLKFTSGF